MPDCPICGAHFRFTRRFAQYYYPHVEACRAKQLIEQAKIAALPWWKKLFHKKPKPKHPNGDPFMNFINDKINKK